MLYTPFTALINGASFYKVTDNVTDDDRYQLGDYDFSVDMPLNFIEVRDGRVYTPTGRVFIYAIPNPDFIGNTFLKQSSTSFGPLYLTDGLIANTYFNLMAMGQVRRTDGGFLANSGIQTLDTYLDNAPPYTALVTVGSQSVATTYQYIGTTKGYSSRDIAYYNPVYQQMEMGLLHPQTKEEYESASGVTLEEKTSPTRNRLEWILKAAKFYVLYEMAFDSQHPLNLPNPTAPIERSIVEPVYNNDVLYNIVTVKTDGLTFEYTDPLIHRPSNWTPPPVGQDDY
jgi:hypothetical protein